MNSDLNENRADELIHRGYESDDLDYKESFDDSTGMWMELAKDVYAMSNFGGGYLVIGVQDGSFKPVGLDPAFHKDAQEWIERVGKWATGRVKVTYFEYQTNIGNQQRKFPIIYVHGSIGSLVVPKVEGRYLDKRGVQQVAFRPGVIYTRKTASSAPATGDDFWGLFWALLRRTAEATGSQGTPLEVLSALSKKTEPDATQEKLWFNLFPVTEIPDFVYFASTDLRYPRDIYNAIDSKLNATGGHVDVPAFILTDRRIFSFSPFDSGNPLTICSKGDAERVSIETWMSDESKRQRLVMLLNFNLRNLCRKKGFYHDVKHDRYYKRYFGGPVPTITWKPYKKTRERQLVYLRFGTHGQLLYYEHFAGRLRFVMLGKGLYLLVEPIRVLTLDGQNPLDQSRNVRILTKESFHYHNNNYLYDMKLWLRILAGNSQEVHLGDRPNNITVSVLPINSTANFGILEDQYTSEDFLDSLKSEPFEYVISEEESEEDNPLTETPMEEQP
jgi:hypothetical protein